MQNIITATKSQDTNYNRNENNKGNNLFLLIHHRRNLYKSKSAWVTNINLKWQESINNISHNDNSNSKISNNSKNNKNNNSQNKKLNI